MWWLIVLCVSLFCGVAIAGRLGLPPVPADNPQTPAKITLGEAF